MLTLRLVFHLALRQAEAFARSVLQLLGMALSVPDHTTLSRRGRAFAGRQPRVQAGTGPVHLVLDSAGPELFGQGEWCAAKHGRLRRRWLKLHLGVDASTGEFDHPPLRWTPCVSSCGGRGANDDEENATRVHG